ncbi:hypothetical protein F511_10169 [Dorcoceras hygrometricum]|uniref:Uncharacterized protein n=1 Tax=Dorcoceras hygrometricum TaxID=472368 RepID=A0A2Z7B8V4_9LAMI|nr:hypothetical protein F511_10169 [Dorcoceras hygrometricum]
MASYYWTLTGREVNTWRLHRLQLDSTFWGSWLADIIRDHDRLIGLRVPTKETCFPDFIRGCINCFIMSSIKNPLAAILDSNKFTGLNYQDWLRNLNIVLASEKLLYTIEKSPPKEAPADISPEELTTLQ